MLFPTDPNKRPELWSAFATKVAGGSLSFVIHSGKRLSDGDRQAPTVGSVDEIVSLFRTAAVVRFGSSRGDAIGPFFAFNLDEGTARLVEYAVDSTLQSSSEEVVREALQSVAINLFFERIEITHIFLLLTLPKWAGDEWHASAQGANTILSRKMPES